MRVTDSRATVVPADARSRGCTGAQRSGRARGSRPRAPGFLRVWRYPGTSARPPRKSTGGRVSEAGPLAVVDGRDLFGPGARGCSLEETPMRNRWQLPILSMLALASCGADEGGRGADAGQSGSGIGSITGGATEGGDTDSATGGGTGQGEGEEGNSNPSGASGSADESGGIKFDLEGQPDVNLGCDQGGGGGGGGADFSYIWIANSN